MHNDSSVEKSAMTGIDGLLYTSAKAKKIYIPAMATDVQAQILLQHHDSCAGGHLGSAKLMESVQRFYHWPGMQKSVVAYARTCDACQHSRSSNQPPGGLLQPLAIPEERWEHIDDQHGPCHSASPHQGRLGCHLCVCVDRLSKMIHLAAIKTAVSAPQLAKVFIDTIFKHHGLPKAIVSDRDPRFTSNFWRAVTARIGCHQAMSTAHHPQTDGQTERANRSLKDMLRCYVNSKQNDWDEYLAPLEFAYNNAQQSSTGHSPFFLNHGRHPCANWSIRPTATSQVPAALEFVDKIEEAVQQAQAAIQRAQASQSHYANRRRRDLSFQVGEEVMLSTANLPKVTGLQPRWVGPFKIKKVISANAYRLELPANMKIHPVINVSQLKPYRRSPDEAFPDRPNTRPPPLKVFENDDEEYEVEEILGHRMQRKRRGQPLLKEYLIKWKGYPTYDATWEPESHLDSALDILQQYKKDQPDLS